MCETFHSIRIVTRNDASGALKKFKCATNLYIGLFAVVRSYNAHVPLTLSWCELQGERESAREGEKGKR